MESQELHRATRSTTTQTGDAKARRWTRLTPKRRFWMPFLVVVGIILVACGSTPKNQAPDFTINVFQGQEAVGGDQVALSQLLGTRPIVVNFWAGLCPPCRAEMPDLQMFYEGSKDEVTLLGIDVGQFTGLGNRRNAASLLKELDVTYPAGYTNDGSVVRKYGVVGMPTTVFINPDGTVFQTWSGGLNLDILNRLSGAMLNQAAQEQVPS